MTIDGFTIDGIRALGDGTVVEANLVKNSVQLSSTHNDCVQSWSRDADGKVGAGEVVGLVIRGNLCISHEDSNHPFPGKIQGIGFFDGFYRNTLIEQNIILTDTYHGIALYGGIDSIIRNNTVLDVTNGKPGPTWIRAFGHKNGTLPVNVLIEKNITNKVSLSTTTNITQNNYIANFADYSTTFKDISNGDATIIGTMVPAGVGATPQAVGSSLAAPTLRSYGPVVTNPTTPTATTTPNPKPTPTPTASTTPVATGWTACAVENTKCEFTGTKTVRYGAGTKFFTKVATGGIMCDNKNFGDPAYKVVKRCEISTAVSNPTPTPTPTVDTDTDKDTVLNTIDNCVSVANLDQANFDTDTKGDACDSDDDNDGIRDTQEKIGCSFNPSLTCGVRLPPTPTPTSTTGGFKIGDVIEVTKNVNVRTTGLLNPSTLKGINPQGSRGTIIAGPTMTDDRFGKITWFNVNFDTGFDGWVGADNYKRIGISDGVSTPVATATVATRISISENVNVRTEANGTKIGIQYKGAKGKIVSTVAAVSNSSAGVGSAQVGWVNVDFDSGADGFVASQYVTTRAVSGVTDVTAQIKILIERLAELQKMLAELQKISG